MTTKKTRKFGPKLPLVSKYLKRITKLPRKTHQELQGTIGITWNLRGKTFVPLGHAAMLVQSTHPADNRLGVMIEQTCFNAQVDPRNGEIHYSNRRMSHDFSIVPYPGAKGRILDPREKAEGKGQHANADWVRLGIEVHQARAKACHANWRLETIPQLPKFWAGFESMSAIDMEITEAMLEDIAGHQQIPLAKVRAMTEDDLSTLAKAHWPALWKAPNTEGNDTRFWLIEARYVTKFERAHMFEDFSELVGVDTWNPVRGVTGGVFANQTRTIAKAAGIDLDNLIAVLNTSAEQSGDDTTDAAYDNAVDKAMADLAIIRTQISENLGVYADLYTVEDLTAAVMNPDERFEIPVEKLTLDDVVSLMRLQLTESQPLLAAVVTDDELREAAQYPDTALRVSKACRVQILFRDTRRKPEDSMNFSFGDRVFANLWQPVCVERKNRQSKNEEITRDDVSEPVPVTTGT